jgi:hypothetical protein
MTVLENRQSELPHSCVAFDHRVYADIPLPGADFNPRRHPAGRISLREDRLAETLKPLDRRLVSTTLSRRFTLRTRREESPANTRLTWALEAENAVTFAWRQGSHEVRYEPGPGHDPALFGFLFLHSFLPVYFTINRDYHVLHAAGMEIAGRTLVFLAPSMGGKSTLTDYLVNRGHRFLSDDKLATFQREEGYCAVGSYPYRRPYREAECLGDFTPAFASSPRRIHALYALTRAEPDSKVRIGAMPGLERFRQLTDGRDVILSFRKAEDFSYLTGMAQHLPLFQLRLPWCLDRLPDVHDALLRHARHLDTANP